MCHWHACYWMLLSVPGYVAYVTIRYFSPKSSASIKINPTKASRLGRKAWFPRTDEAPEHGDLCKYLLNLPDCKSRSQHRFQSVIFGPGSRLLLGIAEWRTARTGTAAQWMLCTGMSFLVMAQSLYGKAKWLSSCGKCVTVKLPRCRSASGLHFSAAKKLR